MLALHISYGNRELDEWVPLADFPLKPHAPHSEDSSHGVLEVREEPLMLPNGESLRFSVAFTEFNRGMSLLVQSENDTVLSVAGFKSSISTYDPAVTFLSPSGLHLSLMVGPVPGRK